MRKSWRGNDNWIGGHQSYHREDTVAWTAGDPGKTAKYAAVFNLANQERAISLKWRDIGVPKRNAAVRDLWARENLGDEDGISIELAPHASVPYKVEPK